MRALWLADALRAVGLTVVEQPGWQTRGKELDAVDGVCAHHTASPTSSTLATNLSVVINGNSVAPGPIANLLLWRDGTWHVIAAGRANHAGAGGPLSWLPAGMANRRTLGVEAVNNGVGEPWSPEMVVSYEIGVAALLRHEGLPAARTFTHAEWAPTRKIDPAGPNGGRIAYWPGRGLTWSPDAWRAAVDKWLTPVPPPLPTPTEDDDMPLHLAYTGPADGASRPELLLVQGKLVGFTSPEQRDAALKATGAPSWSTADPVQYDEVVRAFRA